MTSGGPFALGCLLLVVLWVPTLFMLSHEDSQFLLQTVLAIITFLLVALLQNAQKRNEEAINVKLNALAEGIADLMRHQMGDDKDLHDNIERLTEHTIGFEERVSSRSSDR